MWHIFVFIATIFSVCCFCSLFLYGVLLVYLFILLLFLHFFIILLLLALLSQIPHITNYTTFIPKREQKSYSHTYYLQIYRDILTLLFISFHTLKNFFFSLFLNQQQFFFLHSFLLYYFSLCKKNNYEFSKQFNIKPPKGNRNGIPF